MFNTMSLLDELHRRVDRLTPQQQKNLKLWLDYQDRRRESGESDDLAQLAQAAAKHLDQALPDDDWSEQYALEVKNLDV